MRLRAPARALVLLVAALAVFGAREGAAQTAASAADPFADIAFIAGQWVGELGGGRIEETWSAPDGDNMMGMFRLVRDGGGAFYEFMLIERTESGLVLRLRHFSPRLIAWEEKDAPLDFALAEVEEGRVVFRQDGEPTRLVYDGRQAGTLTVTLEKMSEGRLVPQEFRFRRAP